MKALIIAFYHVIRYGYYLQKQINATLNTICPGIEVLYRQVSYTYRLCRLLPDLNTSHVWWGSSVIARCVADVECRKHSSRKEEQPETR